MNNLQEKNLRKDFLLMINFYTNGMGISDRKGEIVFWHEEEWKEDPEVVYAMMNAVRLYCEEGPEALRERIDQNG